MITNFMGLIINVSILFGVGSIYILIPFDQKRTSLVKKIISGLLTGFLLIIIMNASFVVSEGIVLDTRSVLLSVTAAFLGPIPAGIATLMASILRLSQGGAGAYTGVLVIVSTTLVGLIFRKYRVNKLEHKKLSTYVEIYLFGVVVHVVMLLLFLTLPSGLAIPVLRVITLPVMVFYPAVTIPVVGILMYQRKNALNATAVEYLSEHDYLTGFYNRLYLEKVFWRYEVSHNVGIIMGDANGLKTINDSYGHLVGDELLILIADILKRSTPEDAVTVRWGGDEFVILIENTSLLDLNNICLNIKKECMKESIMGVSPSISLGYSITESFDLDRVFSEAEDLMYRNKLSEGASTRSSIVSSLENTLYERKYETEFHSSNMADLAEQIGKKLGLMQDELDNLALTAKLHDLGKIGVSETILLKPGKLSTEEFKEVKKHSLIGYKILESIEELKHISAYVLHHHEKWDGSGYPYGLSGEEIPLLSRIITLVDSFEAMTSGRVYQVGKSIEQAKQELKDCSGNHFDPVLVELLLDIL